MKKLVKRAANFLSSIEIWVVSGIILLSIVKTDFLPWAVLIAAIFWPIRWLANGRLSQRTPADFGVAVLLLMIPVTLWATALPEKTVPQVYRLALGILFFYTIINWTRDQKKLILIISGITLAGAGLAGMAIFSVNWITTKIQVIPAAVYQRFNTLISDVVHPNVMAGNIVIIVPIGIAILLFTWKQLKWWQTTLFLIATLFTTGIVILTQSRGALLGLGAALLLAVMLRWRWGWVSIPLVALGGILLIYQLGLETILDFISSGVSVEGTEGRVEIWSRAIYMIQDFSFTGIGLGSFMDVADLLYPFFLAAPGKIVHAHNLFLQVAVDIGIPGLIAWLSILITIIAICWQLYRFGKLEENRWAAGLGVGLLGSQIALMIHGIMDAVTWGMIRPAPLVWGIWGTAIAAWLIIVIPHPGNNLNIESE